MIKTWNWLKKEFREILPVWFFFFCAFALLSFSLAAILRGYDVLLAKPHEFLIGSLIMAKVVLMVDTFLNTGRFAGRPLIYPTLWNTCLYFLGALVFHHLEQVFTLMRQHHVRLGEAVRETLHAAGEPRYGAIMAWLLAIVFAFCAFRELSRSIGSNRLMEMFFGRSSRRRLSSTGAPPAAA